MGDAQHAGGPTDLERHRIRVTGTVQGVGFRPFVYREASALGLTGFVLNDSEGVLIEAEGAADSLAALRAALVERAPPLARVTTIDGRALAPDGSCAFEIIESSSGGSPSAPVSVDSASCEECLAEVDDPADRRYQYPFTNCTNCGPRYTIVIEVPYDRPATTMAGFVMCVDCQREYDDPLDRRFHAQPNSCPVCGPSVRFCNPSGTVIARSAAALDRTVEALEAGEVVAIKGLGGYHLAVDATSEQAVGRLRQRKARDDKPFAVMVPDLHTARTIADLDELAAEALTSTRRPIVLASRARGVGRVVAEGVAPGLPELGLMLPYTPLHHILMTRLAGPLVMTSGNLSDEPIAHDDDDAFERLAGLVDCVLAHDRPIHIRCDDSVVRSPGGRLQLIRRSRGYSPEPLPLAGESSRHVLAVGAELKNTVSVAKGSQIVTSHHIGDLEHLATYRSFLQATDHLCRLFGVEPEVVVHDLHPEYLSTKYAVDLGVNTWAVQHHHAHVASCLAEHRRNERVLGIAYDGLGYGLDGDLWGGEFLVADLEGFERAGHLLGVPMPGGAAAIREPWRMAMSWAACSGGVAEAARVGAELDGRWRAVLSLIESDGRAAHGDSARNRPVLGMPRTTSAGRLFDAVAALIGLRSRVTYEGQAAIELEAEANRVATGDAPRYPVEVRGSGADGLLLLDPSPLVATVLDELKIGRAPEVIAAGFHEGLAAGTVTVASRLAKAHGLSTAVLTGGVFQNVRLTRLVQSGLEENGLEVLLHSQVPPNDGGISIGQAAIGALAAGPPLS